MNWKKKLQLVKFFLLLYVKEHWLSKLNVRPLVAELFMTENCNLRCVSCTCWHEFTRNELSTCEWKNVIEQLIDLDFIKLNFTGGEPLLRKDLVELIEYASSQGELEIHLNTNAILLTPEKLQQLLDAGVRSFNISLDAPNSATHNLIRGRDKAFETTIKHLRHLSTQKKQYGLKIRVNFTVMKDNYTYLPQMAELVRDLDVRLYLNLASDQTFLFRDNRVTQLMQVDLPGLKETLKQMVELKKKYPKHLPSFVDFKYIEKHFQDIIQREIPCAESQLKLMIHSQGQIGGCWGHDPKFNVREKSVKEILGSSEYIESHAAFFKKQCVGCGSNYSLNLRWRPSSWIRNFMWNNNLLSSN